MKQITFALVTSIALVLPAAAQEPIRVPWNLTPRVTAAGAFDARNNGRHDPEMYLGLVTLEWPTSVPGLAWRVDGLYARRDRISHVEPGCARTLSCDQIPTGATFAFLSSKVTAAGVTGGVTYDLRRRGALRPYVLAGAGIMRSHDKYTSGNARYYRCDPGCIVSASAEYVPTHNARPLSAAGQVGLGLVYSWQWLSVLAETRYVAVDYSNTRGVNGAVPVSLGVRF